ANAIVLGGSGSNRTVTITPVSGQTGSATITLTVTDGGGLTATSSFTVTVNPPPNTPPTISIFSNQTITTGQSAGPLPLTPRLPRRRRGNSGRFTDRHRVILEHELGQRIGNRFRWLRCKPYRKCHAHRWADRNNHDHTDGHRCGRIDRQRQLRVERQPATEH